MGATQQPFTKHKLFYNVSISTAKGSLYWKLFSFGYVSKLSANRFTNSTYILVCTWRIS